MIHISGCLGNEKVAKINFDKVPSKGHLPSCVDVQHAKNWMKTSENLTLRLYLSLKLSLGFLHAWEEHWMASRSWTAKFCRCATCQEFDEGFRKSWCRSWCILLAVVEQLKRVIECQVTVQLPRCVDVQRAKSLSCYCRVLDYSRLLTMQFCLFTIKVRARILLMRLKPFFAN